MFGWVEICTQTGERFDQPGDQRNTCYMGEHVNHLSQTLTEGVNIDSYPSALFLAKDH